MQQVGFALTTIAKEGWAKHMGTYVMAQGKI